MKTELSIAEDTDSFLVLHGSTSCLRRCVPIQYNTKVLLFCMQRICVVLTYQEYCLALSLLCRGGTVCIRLACASCLLANKLCLKKRLYICGLGGLAQQGYTHMLLPIPKKYWVFCEAFCMQFMAARIGSKSKEMKRRLPKKILKRLRYIKRFSSKYNHIDRKTSKHCSGTAGQNAIQLSSPGRLPSLMKTQK